MQFNIRKSILAATAFSFAVIAGSAYAADSAAGMGIYNTKCKTCHGADGAGNPGMAKALKVEFKPLGGAAVQGQSDADLKAVITNGKGKMHAVAGVAGADLDNVVAYVRSLKK